METFERTPWPSVREHPVNVLLDDAAELGSVAVQWLAMYRFTHDEKHLNEAVALAREAASLYHEAEREHGICPMCGDEAIDDRGRRVRNDSMPCCYEPRQGAA